MMTAAFPYRPGVTDTAFYMEEHYIWDCSVIRAGGKYHMFSSRWPRQMGFGWNWLFNSEIIHAVSDVPEGPYTFQNVVLPRRGAQFFDGMSTHNTCIREYGGKYYLYYMGTTYAGEVPQHMSEISDARGLEAWNRKRIGLAVADSIDGPFVRRDTALLEPRDCSCWDCTATTNPAVAILPDGRTYMIYKSRAGAGQKLQLGVAAADSPEGPFRRLSDAPILQFADENLHVEDPFLWYDAQRKKFCLIAKDDCKNGSQGITGEWGGGFYAESDDCIHFVLAEEPCVYTRTVEWPDGSRTKQGNLERPALLFDENGVPTHLFCATGTAQAPYDFTGNTFVVCTKLIPKE